jgi:hypothetical protein
VGYIPHNGRRKMKFDIEIYVKADGTKPVREFLDSLEDKMRAKVTRGIWLLGEYGNEILPKHWRIVYL